MPGRGPAGGAHGKQQHAKADRAGRRSGRSEGRGAPSRAASFELVAVPLGEAREESDIHQRSTAFPPNSYVPNMDGEDSVGFQAKEPPSQFVEQGRFQARWGSRFSAGVVWKGPSIAVASVILLIVSGTVAVVIFAAVLAALLSDRVNVLLRSPANVLSLTIAALFVGCEVLFLTALVLQWVLVRSADAIMHSLCWAFRPTLALASVVETMREVHQPLEAVTSSPARSLALPMQWVGTAMVVASYVARMVVPMVPPARLPLLIVAMAGRGVVLLASYAVARSTIGGLLPVPPRGSDAAKRLVITSELCFFYSAFAFTLWDALWWIDSHNTETLTVLAWVALAAPAVLRGYGGSLLLFSYRVRLDKLTEAEGELALMLWEGHPKLRGQDVGISAGAERLPMPPRSQLHKNELQMLLGVAALTSRMQSAHLFPRTALLHALCNCAGVLQEVLQAGRSAEKGFGLHPQTQHLGHVLVSAAMIANNHNEYRQASVVYVTKPVESPSMSVVLGLDPSEDTDRFIMKSMTVQRLLPYQLPSECQCELTPKVVKISHVLPTLLDLDVKAGTPNDVPVHDDHELPRVRSLAGSAALHSSCPCDVLVSGYSLAAEKANHAESFGSNHSGAGSRALPLLTVSRLSAASLWGLQPSAEGPMTLHRGDTPGQLLVLGGPRVLRLQAAGGRVAAPHAGASLAVSGVGSSTKAPQNSLALHPEPPRLAVWPMPDAESTEQSLGILRPLDSVDVPPVQQAPQGGRPVQVDTINLHPVPEHESVPGTLGRPESGQPQAASTPMSEHSVGAPSVNDWIGSDSGPSSNRPPGTPGQSFNFPEPGDDTSGPGFSGLRPSDLTEGSGWQGQGRADQSGEGPQLRPSPGHSDGASPHNDESSDGAGEEVSGFLPDPAPPQRWEMQRPAEDAGSSRQDKVGRTGSRESQGERASRPGRNASQGSRGSADERPGYGSGAEDGVGSGSRRSSTGGVEGGRAKGQESGSGQEGASGQAKSGRHRGEQRRRRPAPGSAQLNWGEQYKLDTIEAAVSRKVDSFDNSKLQSQSMQNSPEMPRTTSYGTTAQGATDPFPKVKGRAGIPRPESGGGSERGRPMGGSTDSLQGGSRGPSPRQQDGEGGAREPSSGRAQRRYSSGSVRPNSSPSPSGSPARSQDSGWGGALTPSSVANWDDSEAYGDDSEGYGGGPQGRRSEHRDYEADGAPEQGGPRWVRRSSRDGDTAEGEERDPVSQRRARLEARKAQREAMEAAQQRRRPPAINEAHELDMVDKMLDPGSPTGILPQSNARVMQESHFNTLDSKEESSSLWETNDDSRQRFRGHRDDDPYSNGYRGGRGGGDGGRDGYRRPRPQSQPLSAQDGPTRNDAGRPRRGHQHPQSTPQLELSGEPNRNQSLNVSDASSSPGTDGQGRQMSWRRQGSVVVSVQENSTGESVGVDPYRHGGGNSRQFGHAGDGQKDLHDQSNESLGSSQLLPLPPKEESVPGFGGFGRGLPGGPADMAGRNVNQHFRRAQMVNPGGRGHR